MKDIRAIRNEADYEWALREVEPYFENPPEMESEEATRFDILSALISNYESQHHEIPDVDPVDVLHFAIDNMGRTQAELATIVGSRSRASEILNRRRRLTLTMIRDISAAWKISVGCLTGAYELHKEYA